MNPNHRRVTEGLHVLTGVLAPYVARELRAKLADEWWPRGVFDVLYEHQRRDLPAAGEDDALIARLDPARCLLLMDLHWNDLFRRKLSREHRTWIKELIATRNKWAHAGLVDMADEDAWRALDSLTQLVDEKKKHLGIDAFGNIHALLIGHLATDMRYERRGVGRAMANWSIVRIMVGERVRLGKAGIPADVEEIRPIVVIVHAQSHVLFWDCGA